MGKVATILETNKIKNFIWPKKSRWYIVCRIGVYSKLVGIQMGPFRFNMHYDNFNKMPDTFERLNEKVS